MVDAFKEFPHLLAPLQIGDVVYRNRMFCAPTGHTDDIAPGQPSIDGLMAFERIAIGGAATVAEGEVIIDHTESSRAKFVSKLSPMSVVALEIFFTVLVGLAGVGMALFAILVIRNLYKGQR